MGKKRQVVFMLSAGFSASSFLCPAFIQAAFLGGETTDLPAAGAAFRPQEAPRVNQNKRRKRQRTAAPTEAAEGSGILMSAALCSRKSKRISCFLPLPNRLSWRGRGGGILWPPKDTSPAYTHISSYPSPSASSSFSRMGMDWARSCSTVFFGSRRRIAGSRAAERNRRLSVFSRAA